MTNIPVPGYEDLYPHVALLDLPGDSAHGEPILRLRAMAVLIAPSVEDFVAEWQTQEPLIRAGLMQHFRMPAEWQQSARRRSNELMAHYNTDVMFEVLRGLERDYGALSAQFDTPTQP